MGNCIAPGLTRLAARSEIVSASYDWETHRIGFIQTPILSMFYTEPYYEGGEWSIHDMWVYMGQHVDALACTIANMKYLVAIYRDTLHLYDYHEYDPKVYVNSPAISFNPSIHVGFVRTCPKYKDANISPYKLYMDEDKCVSVGGKEPFALPDAIPTSGSSLYKLLISTDYNIVYNTENGPKFL